MDLGTTTLRGSGTNLLQNAIHSRHGLVWTDGKSIYLAPVRLYSDKLEHAKSSKLGEFEYVDTVHWSADIERDVCFLCVVHQKNVSVWRVSGNGPKLGFKQVRKINVQPIPQGILWNPGREILCVLSRQQCSFYYNHTQNKSSYAFPQLESGKFSCGSWSEDGQRLVVCTGSILLIYTWPDIDSSINDFTPTVWKIPQVDGSVISLCPVARDLMVCAAELPLEQLCKDRDTFLVPDVVSSSKNAKIMKSEGDVIQSSNNLSLKDSLLNLPTNPKAMLHDTSQLIVIKFKESVQDPEKISSTGINSLLAPDLLTYERNNDIIVLGSNTQSVLQVFTLIDNKIVRVSDIKLDKNHRPKGVSQVPAVFSSTNTGVLVMSGEKQTHDTAFLPTTTESKYHLSLSYFPLKIDKTWLRNSFSGKPSIQVKDSMQVKSLSGSLIIPNSNNNNNSNNNQASVLPLENDIKITTTHSSNTKDVHKTKMILVMNPESEKNGTLETETVHFSDHPPLFKNPKTDKSSEINDRTNDVPSGVKNILKQKVESSSLKTDHLEDSLSDRGSSVSNDSSCEILEQQIRAQKEQIEKLQRKISELSQVVEDAACVFPTKYQSPESPEKVKICCKYLNGSEKSRIFLLDSGRLQLEPIKQAFSLATVELIIDGEPCVLGMNIDGYIPMKFSPSSVLHITGLSSSSSLLIKEET